jgi:hypothetical protein
VLHLVSPVAELLMSGAAVRHTVGELPLVLAYVGPDQILPLASVFGAIVGVALMFWHKLVAGVRRTLGLFRRRPDASPGDPTLGSRP